MNYEIQRPRKSLELYIESIWVQEDLRNAAFENYRPTRVLPRGAIELLFHYRDLYVHIEEGPEHEQTSPRTTRMSRSPRQSSTPTKISSKGCPSATAMK